MIGTIRRHKTWVWWAVIAATVVSFVIYFNPASRYGGGGGPSFSSGADLGSVNGEPITLEQLQPAEREGRIFFRLRTGVWPDSQEQKKQVMKWAEQSLVMQSVLKDFKLSATTEAAARFTTEQLFGVPPGQTLPQDVLNEWVQKELMGKGGLTLEDLDRFARHQAAQAYLISLFGMTGKLITSKEVEFTYRRENEPMVTEVVTFPTTNFYGATTPTEA